MPIQLTDTQRGLLSAAAQRNDRLVLPPPGLKGGAVIKVVVKLMDAGFVREVPAEDKAVVWRRDNKTKRMFALKLTAAGLKASSPAPKAKDAAGASKWRAAASAVKTCGLRPVA